MSGDAELVKERLDLAQVVGEYVRLRRVGRHFKGLCPFHNEKTPSFIVSPDKGIWHCFGCQKGGDVYTFMQEIEGIDFPTALKLLAERAGVTLKEQSGGTFRQAQSKRQRLFDLLELAARFYHEILLRQAAGKRAGAYLTERGVSKESWQKFQVGYAPKQWDVLQQFLRSRGYSGADMVAAGVAGENRRGKLFDRFRGRIMFPIRDVQGRVVAFGGRIAPWHATGEEGKYVNSPETSLYEKRRVIYNLDRAKQDLRSGQAAVVVEGYLDVVLLDQIGIKGVVASSGTAFTAEHVQLLARYTAKLHFAFDADTAGQQAALAATHAALRAGMRVATLVLPAGLDPAELAQRDPKQMRAIVAAPRSLVAVLLERLRDTASVAREANLEAVLPLVAQVTNPVLQGELVRDIATILHVPEQQVLGALQRLPAAETSSAAPTVVRDPESESATAEDLLLGMMIISAEVRNELHKDVQLDFFLAEGAKSLYNVLQTLWQGEEVSRQQDADTIVTQVPAALLPYAEGVRRLAEERLAHTDRPAAAEGRALLTSVKRRWLTERLRTLQLRLAESQGEQRGAALREFQQLATELAHL